MSDIAYKPVKTDGGWNYRGVNIHRIPESQVRFEFPIDMGFGLSCLMVYKTLAEARRSIDARIDPRSGMFGANMTNYEVHNGYLTLKGLYK